MMQQGGGWTVTQHSTHRDTTDETQRRRSSRNHQTGRDVGRGCVRHLLRKNAVNGAMTSAKQGISDSIDSVLSLPGKAVDTVVSGAGSMWDSTKKFFSPPASHQQAATYNEPWDPGTGVDW